MGSVSDVTNNLIGSLSENKEGNGFNLDDYTLTIVLECQNQCGTEFSSPIIVSYDEETKNEALVVCNDCPEILDESESEADEDDNEDEELSKIVAHDAAASAELLAN